MLFSEQNDCEPRNIRQTVSLREFHGKNRNHSSRTTGTINIKGENLGKNEIERKTEQAPLPRMSLHMPRVTLENIKQSLPLYKTNNNRLRTKWNVHQNYCSRFSGCTDSAQASINNVLEIFWIVWWVYSPHWKIWGSVTTNLFTPLWYRSIGIRDLGLYMSNNKWIIFLLLYLWSETCVANVIHTFYSQMLEILSLFFGNEKNVVPSAGPDCREARESFVPRSLSERLLSHSTVWKSVKGMIGPETFTACGS